MFLPILISLFFIMFFFLYLIMNWSLWVFLASSSFTVDYCVKLYCMFLLCVSCICTYLHMYAFKYTFMIYLLHMYCIFARYSYDIVVNYICFFVVYHQYSLLSAYLQWRCLVYIMGEMTWHCERCLFLYGEVCSWCSLEMLFFVHLLLYMS